MEDKYYQKKPNAPRRRVYNPRNPRAAVLWALVAAALLFGVVLLLGGQGQP